MLTTFPIDDKVLQRSKNLSIEDKKQINLTIDTILKDPEFQNTKNDFCNMSQRTIFHEFQDRNLALTGYNIVLLQALLSSKNAKKNIHDKSILLQNWSNKYLSALNKVDFNNLSKVYYPANIAAQHEIETLYNKKSTTEDGIVYFDVNIWEEPIEKIIYTSALTSEYNNYNVLITYSDEYISIQTLSENVPTTYILKNMEDEKQHKEEYYEYGFTENEVIKELRRWLPKEAEEVLDVIINPPKDYYDKYGSKSCKSYISQYLQKKPKDIQRLLDMIRIHCISLGISI